MGSGLFRTAINLFLRANISEQFLELNTNYPQVSLRFLEENLSRQKDVPYTSTLYSYRSAFNFITTPIYTHLHLHSTPVYTNRPISVENESS